jgi:hypothetical protein
MNKILILICFCLLTGCSQKGVVATIFLKETSRQFTNMEGDSCLQDGFVLTREDDEKHYNLVTYYKNCRVHETRQLEEFEINDWQPKGTLGIH